MAQPFRLAEGGRIDRTRPLRFRFDGSQFDGFAGDTLASALLAHGQHLLGRSFKYHRPRGLIAAGAEEPNALVQLEHGDGRSDPNSRATVVELFDGLNALSQNRYPSLRRDVGVLNDLVSPLIPAAFYYKTFMWPRAAWFRLYEPLIRRAAGLGRAPDSPDPDRYAHRHAHCDVLVVGAGPAGLEAALTAARDGRRVILADEQTEPGGSLLAESGRLADIDGGRLAWRDRMLTELAGMPEVTLLSRTTVTGYYDHNYLTALQRVSDHLPAGEVGDRPRQRLWRIRAGEVVLATGAIERPLVFVGNDRPGVMLASAARSFLNRYAVRVGDRPMLFTNNDSAYAAALDLHDAGATVAAVVDIRQNPKGPLIDAARDAGIAVLSGTVVVATHGRLRIDRAILAGVNASGRLQGTLDNPVFCDCLLMSGGWNPNVSLFSQSRGRLAFDEARGCFVPGEAFQATRSVGACAGDFTTPDGSDAEEGPMQPVWLVPSDRSGPRARAFVDFQNDVTAKDLGLAVREGMTSIEHVKRFTTTGMATDQGKTSNVNALAIVAGQLGTPLPAVGTTTFRPPYTPLTYGAIVGHSRGALFDVVRKTPMHERAVELGAVFEDVGNWKRAWYFPEAGEDRDAAVARECRTVRATGGLFDASTLGKIDVRGPDARDFLNRVYTNAWSKLAPGRCRYGLMLRDDGFVFDDGVTACIADDHFHMTTTTGGAARVLAWLEDLLQTEWTELRVYLTSVTEQWATIAVSGPQARATLAPLVDGDLSAEALPHMAWCEARVAGVDARIFRISFTGETAFEINVPADYGAHVWDRLAAAGQAAGICVYGTETMHVLRAEKGYIIVGQETDGTVTPQDLGMDWIVSKTKADFIGKRGLARPDLTADGRKQLVGLLTQDPKCLLDEGAQLTERYAPGQKLPMIGHVTSSYRSPNVGRTIAMALVKDGRARIGSRLLVPQLDDRAAEVEVVAPVFFDPEGARLDG